VTTPRRSAHGVRAVARTKGPLVVTRPDGETIKIANRTATKAARGYVRALVDAEFSGATPPEPPTTS
jgi:hypothetical protein